MTSRAKVPVVWVAATIVATSLFGLVNCGASTGLGNGAAPTPGAASSARTSRRVIGDIAHWQHPTKAVFAKYGVTLRKVTIIDKRPSFEVQFPFDPQTSPNERMLVALCVELLEANGQWPYALVSLDEKIEFDVSWDQRAGKVSIENHPYAPEEHPR